MTVCAVCRRPFGPYVQHPDEHPEHTEFELALVRKRVDAAARPWLLLLGAMFGWEVGP